MFRFQALRDRTVVVLLKDGRRCQGRYRAILESWFEAKPTLWLSDWSLEHFLSLDRIFALETLFDPGREPLEPLVDLPHSGEAIPLSPPG